MRILKKVWHWLEHLHLTVWILAHVKDWMLYTAFGASVTTGMAAYVRSATPGMIGLWVVGIGILVLLLLLFAEEKTTPLVTESQPSTIDTPTAHDDVADTPEPPLVLIDLIEGVVAQVGAEVRILLRVRVRNGNVPDLGANDWSLDLFHEGKHWKYAHKNPLPHDLQYERAQRMTRIEIIQKEQSYDHPKTLNRDLDEQLKKMPLDPRTSQDGWLSFFLYHAMIEHAFAATYEVVLIDQHGHQYRGRRDPGEWLSPGRLSRTSGANV